MDASVRNAGVVSLAIDAWEDHAHFATLGITVRPLKYGAKSLLLSFFRHDERQTADVLGEHMAKARKLIEDGGTRVIAAISDNGSNMQAGIAMQHGLVSLNCLAH